MKWKNKWVNGMDGRWTRSLINNMEAWICREHGDVSYEPCQFLTGHGQFGTFQFKIKKVPNERCRYSQNERDNPEHTIFYCDRFAEIRDDCTRKEGNITSS